MKPKHFHDRVRSRNEPFNEKLETKIWREMGSEDNAYIPQSALCHGYDLVELMQKKNFSDVFYLLFRGELPSQEQSELLGALMIALVNPGPRHHATRAAMNAAVGKTNPLHILPIGISVLGGEHMGGGIIDKSIRFLRKSKNIDPVIYAKEVVEELKNIEVAASDNQEAYWANKMPGFGRFYGGIDLLTEKIAVELSLMPAAGTALKWGVSFHRGIKDAGVGWLSTGIAAAVFSDLGFQPKAGGVLFQLLGAPGLAAHGLELANKPLTSMPYIKDEYYAIEENI